MFVEEFCDTGADTFVVGIDKAGIKSLLILVRNFLFHK
jgi:hypothetical protein